jgi:WD40 repeat protein
MPNAIPYQSMKLLLNIEEPETVGHTVISPDSKKFAVINSINVKVRDIETGKLIHDLRPQGVPKSLTISKDGQMIAAGCHDDKVTVWNFHTGEKLHSFDGSGEFPNDVRCVGITHDNKILLAGSGITIHIWNLETGKRRSPLRAAGSRLIISEDGKIVLCEYLSRIRIVELSTGDKLLDFEQESCVGSIAMNRDSSKFATGDHEGMVTLYHTSNAEKIITWQARSSPYGVTELIISPDNQTIISGGLDQYIHFFNLHTGEKIHTLEIQPYRLSSMSLSPDGMTLVTTSSCPESGEGLTSIVSVWGIR